MKSVLHKENLLYHTSIAFVQDLLANSLTPTYTPSAVLCQVLTPFSELHVLCTNANELWYVTD